MIQIIGIVFVVVVTAMTMGRLWLEYKRYDRRRLDLIKKKDQLSTSLKKYQETRERRPNINQMKATLHRLKADELEQRLGELDSES